MVNIKKNMNSSMERNVRADYVYCFLHNFDISSAIWVLYMVFKGLPLYQVGIAEGVFHVSSFLFEVPSGALADLFGRKRVIIIGRILSAVSAVMMFFSSNVFSFSIAFIVSALSYNLNSGSEEALVYDSMKAVNKEEAYIKVNSRINMIIEVSQGIATFAGGVLAQYSYSVCYITVIVISLISILPALLFKEPAVCIKGEKEERISLVNHFKKCYQILKGNRELLKVLLYFPMVFTFNTIVYYYGQQYFSLLGFNKISISLIMLLSGSFSVLGAFSCEKVISVLGEKTKYAASVLMGISIIIISLNNAFLAVAFFAIMNYANSLLYPIQSNSLNKLIPSGQRATILSIDSMLFSMFMVLLFPLSGLIADKLNLNYTFFGLGILQITLMIILLRKKR